ncbi:MAG: hypothetical protein AB1634_12375 [Thermodesulfobacteriota bacterium]
MIIDPDLKYCPQCQGEFRPQIERCAACRVELLSGAEMQARQEARRSRRQARAGSIGAGDEVVAIQRGRLPDIRQLEELLARERIACLVQGDDASCGKGCCPTTFYLLVRREDARDALEIMNEEHRRTTGLDSHEAGHGDAIFDPAAAEAVCPACGERFSTQTTTCPECGLCFG